MMSLRWTVNCLRRYSSTLNASNLIAVGQKRSIKRWVAPTLKVLRSRFEKMPDHLRPGLQKRSEFVEWNYRAELFAFGKRLNEPFSLSLLQTAFTQNSYVARERLKQEKLGIENAELEMNDNEELAKHGQHIANEYIIKFIEKSFPLLLTEGQVAIRNYLLSEETLAYVASNLGMLDLLLDVDYPPSTESFARSLLAVIGALEKSTGDLERTQCFIQDFICTQLNQKDIMEIWIIDDPETLLRNLCRERKIAEPEARLLGDCGRNTVLAAYYVGLYSNKKLIGKGFGEDVPTAVKTAALDALQILCGISESRKPLEFNVKPTSDAAIPKKQLVANK